jgi:uncharacterized protein (TIGR02996 family)
MRRFEFRDGKSNKFWEIELDGTAFRTRHGRIGTAGRETRKPFGSAASAAKQVESAIASKLKKGYVEVDGATPAEAKPAEAEPATPIAALERKLIAEPDAHDDWLVYADALASAGDPRGELITIGVALARAEGDPSQLRAREDALLQANAEAWFGKFVSDDDWRECFGWTLTTGFWGRIRLWVDHDHAGTDIPKALAHALGHPSARFLRELVLGLTSTDGDADYEGCIRALISHGPLPSLRSMIIGDFDRDQSEISWVQVGNVGPLWPLLPNLERLTLKGAGIRLGNPKSTTLRTLVIHSGGLPQAAGQSLGRAELPALEHLEVWFGTTDYGGSCSAAEARGILQNKSLARLRSLALANADFADEIAAEVAQAQLWPTLERLDLSMGTMSDAGAERLLTRAEELARLAHIDLSNNFLSPDMCDRIQAALPNANVDMQQQADGDRRYVSVGE